MASTSPPGKWQCALLYFLLLLVTVAHGQLLSNAVEDYGLTTSHDSSKNYTQLLARQAGQTTDPDFWQAVSKGCGRLAMMAKDNVDQSVFTATAALADNGWKAYAPTTTEALKADVTPIYESLGISTDPADNPLYNWRQKWSGDTSVAYGKIAANAEYGASNGNYENSLFPAAGMLLFLNNYSPAYMISEYPNDNKGPIPPLQRLSDVLWLQWQDAVQATGQASLLSNIKYVYIHLVGDWQSRVVLEAAYQIEGQSLEVWPGRTYPMVAEDGIELDIAMACLGTPVANAVVFMLAQHREIGKKTVSKVQLWGKGDPDVNQLFYVEDV